MNDIEVLSLNREEDIFSTLSTCADSLHNQNVNNEETIKSLSSKYYTYGLCFGIKVRKEVAGFVSCYVNDTKNRRGFLSIIVVKKEYQGLGLGALLLDIVLTSCKLNNIDELVLEVEANNTEATRFYYSRGFEMNQTKEDGVLVLKKELNKRT